MEFWRGNPASPSLWTAYGFGTKAPDYLRKGPPPPVHNAWNLPDGRTGIVRRQKSADAAHVAAFLEANYCGSDWRLSDAASWINRYLDDHSVICLGMLDGSGAGLVATIFSVPFSGGENTHMSHGAILSNVRVIEGLCVSHRYRGAGLAGIMIAHMDSFTYKLYKDTVHIWSREIPFVPPLSTALCNDIYGYRHCVPGPTPNLTLLSWNTFIELWKRNCIIWPGKTIVADAPINRRGDLRAYKYTDKTTQMIIVISDTRRVAEGKKIYEVVWCGSQMDQFLLPGPFENQNFKQALDACACAIGDGLLFAGSCVCGVDGSWQGWTYGRSGAHATYIYNYMPPAFGTCRIYAIREEL